MLHESHLIDLNSPILIYNTLWIYFMYFWFLWTRCFQFSVVYLFFFYIFKLQHLTFLYDIEFIDIGMLVACQCISYCNQWFLLISINNIICTNKYIYLHTKPFAWMDSFDWILFDFIFHYIPHKNGEETWANHMTIYDLDCYVVMQLFFFFFAFMYLKS